MAIAAASSVFRSPSAHSAASRFASQTKPAGSPFRLPIGTPLAQCLSRSPAEMSACVGSLQPYHTATASALMMSMLTVSRCGFGWLPGAFHGHNCGNNSYLMRSSDPVKASLDGFRSYSTTLLTPNSSEGLSQDLVIPVTNFLNEDKGFMTLAGDVFDVPIRKDIIHRVVRWQLAKRRQGTHSTKTISEVSGTGRKPWPQKGTGRARHGSLRGPQFRGGSVMHGPKPRSHAIKLNKKVRRLGLKIALSARAAEGKLMVFEDLEVPSHKTKNIVNFVSQMENAKKILVVDGGPINEKLKLSTQNLHYVNVLPSIGLNVYSILLHDTLVMSRDAVNRIVERMRTPINR